MGFPTVNKFLCCCSLESGGIFLGWVTAVISGIGIASFVAVFILLLSGSDSYTDEFVDYPDQTMLIVLIVVIAIYALYMGLLFFASIQLIRGTKNKNHVQMKLYLVLMGIGAVVSFLQIFVSGTSSVISSIIGALVSIYLFVCIYSLYQKTKIGRSNAGTVYNSHPANLYPAQAGNIYSTQPTINGGMINNQNHNMIYSNPPPSYPGFVSTLNPQNSGVVTTEKV